MLFGSREFIRWGETSLRITQTPIRAENEAFAVVCERGISGSPRFRGDVFFRRRLKPRLSKSRNPPARVWGLRTIHAGGFRAFGDREFLRRGETSCMAGVSEKPGVGYRVSGSGYRRTHAFTPFVIQAWVFIPWCSVPRSFGSTRWNRMAKIRNAMNGIRC